MNTKKTNAISLLVGDREIDPDSVLEAVQKIVQDIDDFLANWLDRAGQAISVHESQASAEMPCTADEKLRNRIEDFRHEKTQWEAIRKKESQEIQDRAEELTRAWLRLESEQRRFLQLRQTPRRGTRLPVEESAAADHEFADSTGTEQAASPSLSVRRPGERKSIAVHGNDSREAAVRQFLRLRQEIESSRQNSTQV